MINLTWKKFVLALGAAGALAIAAACSSTPAAGDGGVNCGGAGSTDCNGTCTVVARDSQNCGTCGKACAATELCSAGTCTPAAGGCTMGTTKCGNECVDTKTDDRNCGMCGTKCGSNKVCSAGACADSCAMGTTKCGMSCVDQQSDRTNCGACGTTCKDGEICSAGKCAVSCQVGLTKCSPSMDGGVADGGDGGSATGDMCTNLQIDPQNCGMCGKVCPLSAPYCEAGTCLNYKDFGPMHTFQGLTTDHYITQGGCSIGGGAAADAAYFCTHFYGPNCVPQNGYAAHTCPNLTYGKMHKNGGCTSNGSNITNTTCQGGPCKIGNWSEITTGLNKLVCRCSVNIGAQ